VTSTGRATDFVQSLERGLAVVRALASSGDPLTPSEVAGETQLTRAAARRFLLTLSELGYVRADRRAFRLTPRVLELGAGYLSALGLPQLAAPHVQEFVDDVRESSSLAVLHGDDVIYVSHVQANRVLSVDAAVGAREPAYATSLGRVLLAAQPDAWLDQYLARVELRPYTRKTRVDRDALRTELANVRRQGWALVDEELEDGLRALAAPVVDPNGRVVAAVNVGLHTSRWRVQAIKSTLLPRLLRLADELGAELAASERHADRRAVAPARAVVGGRSADFVQSLERGLAVIRAFADGRTELTLSEVAVSTGLTRAAARRFLLTLCQLGYVAAAGRTFRLTPRVLELGSGSLSRLTLAEVARPHLRRFVDAVSESSSVAVLDGAEIMYVAHESARRVLAVSIAVGSRDPAWVTSLGRVLLAAADDAWFDDYLTNVELTRHTGRTLADPVALRREILRVRQQGWALVDEEFEQGLRALAVPILDGGGSVVAAVNVSMHATRWTVESIVSTLLPQLRAAAAAIAEDVRAVGATATHA
jgi:IclR family pca regulon transcriptional regulator